MEDTSSPKSIEAKPSEKAATDIVVGIDLGTVNSCVSFLNDQGIPEVIPDSEGKLTQPSVFAFTGDGTPIVGRKAVERSRTDRKNTIFAVKRLIGRKYQSEEAASVKARMPYDVVPAANGDAWVKCGDRVVSPEEVSSYILRHMVAIAEEHLGTRVTKAVITVPAHFNDAQRQATKDAGEIAGLKVLGVINEPTAAAIAYGIDSGEEDEAKRLAIFDLGGGTFDITVLETSGGKFRVLSTNGDTFLGGEDFDLVLSGFLLEDFANKTGVDLSSDKSAIQRIKTAAKKAKQDLSDKSKTIVKIDNVSPSQGSPMDLECEIGVRQLEKLFGPLLSALDGPCLDAMSDAGISANEVDEVLLVGGMTKSPLVSKQCRKIFGKEPNTDINPDTAVAAGAALRAGIIQGLVKNLSLEDVTSLTLGIEVQGGVFMPMLEKNSTIPCECKRLFSTSSPKQPSMTFNVLQGEAGLAINNKSLGLFQLDEIKPSARGVPRIEFSLAVDEDGLVRAAAKDLDTGLSRRLDIIPIAGLSDDEVADLKRENQVIRQEDERRSAKNESRGKPDTPAKGADMDQVLRRMVRDGELSSADAGRITDTRGSIKRLIFATQFRLDAEGKDYPEENRKVLEESLRYSRETLAQSISLAELNGAMVELQSEANKLEGFLEE